MATRRQLAFNIQQQNGRDWCWAAVSSSISLFYDPGSKWSQCRIAGAVFRTNDCCPGGTGSPCDDVARLDTGLRTTGNLTNMIEAPLNFNAIEREINANRVIGVRIQWRAGGGHFVVIHGYEIKEMEQRWLFVADPRRGNILIKLWDLSNSYDHQGAWSDSYLTDGQRLRHVIVFNNIKEKFLTRGLHFERKIKNQSTAVDVTAIPSGSRGKFFTYLLDFDTLRYGKIQMSEMGFRIVRTRKGETLLYEFHKTKGEIRLAQIMFDSVYVAAFKKALTTLYEGRPRKPAHTTVSLLSLPNIKVEALRLQFFGSQNKDRYVIITPAKMFTVQKLYSRDEFEKTLVMAVKSFVVPEDKFIGG